MTGSETRLGKYTRAKRKYLNVKLTDKQSDFFTLHPEISGKALGEFVRDALDAQIKKLTE